MHFSFLASDGYVFSRTKHMGAEPISGSFVLGGGSVVIENPSRMLGPARLVDKVPMFFLAIPEPAYTAIIAMLLPLHRVDMAGRVERRHEFIAVVCRTRRKFA